LSTEKKILKITDHIYQPKHEILPKKKAEEVLKNLIRNQANCPIFFKAIKGLRILTQGLGILLRLLARVLPQVKVYITDTL
jgi:DNA-directed RNA polymerase subunit H